MPPWLLLLLMLSLTSAFAYQLATRRFGWRVIGYWLVLFVVVMACEALAESANINITRFGELRLLPDLLGIALVMGGMRLIRV